ncbi:uncharacterized protein EI90DRAFT_3042500, partial [Cantharellus anzutake]|uniref:uncharacterized protein n=1 Tax=Cantharellus anzutake TaxID=1750568 RepID=UPI001908BBC5
MDICDALQTVHNFAHGRAQLELDEERLRYYDEHGSFVRQSKIDILMRDHKIHQFQSAEFWLLHDKRELEEELKEREERIVELVQGIEDEREENALERDAEVQRLEQNHQELDTAHTTLRRQKENLEAKLKHEREALEDVKAKFGDLEGRLGRTQLQLTSAQNELSAKDREIQTWHRMEKKDARELDELRRERVDVGLRLQEMEDSVKQGEQEARVERERIEAKVKKEKKALEKRISQLEAQLEEARETILATAASPELGGKEQEPTPTPPPQSQPKSRPRRPVRRKSPEAQDVATDDSEREVQQPAAPKNAKKRKADRAEPELKAPVIPKKKRKLGVDLEARSWLRHSLMIMSLVLFRLLWLVYHPDLLLEFQS